MRNKFLSLLVTGLALAACECAPEQDVSVGQVGVAPGTAEDFKANIKDRVFYAFNKSHLTEESRRTLEAQAGWLKTYPATNATIAGHCDPRGTAEYNRALGERRAHAAKHALTRMGVGHHRLKTISYGKDNPVVAGDTEEVYAQNRVAITTID